MRSSARARRMLLGLGMAAGLAVMALGLMLEGLSRTTASSAEPGTQLTNEPASVLTGSTLDGGYFDLSRHRGTAVVVNVWASWCAPCREELAVLAEAIRHWSGRGVRVIGLNVRDDPDAARTLLEQSGATRLVSVIDRDGSRAATWGAVGVPETYVIDPGGNLRVRALGPITREWLNRHVAPLTR